IVRLPFAPNLAIEAHTRQPELGAQIGDTGRGRSWKPGLLLRHRPQGRSRRKNRERAVARQRVAACEQKIVLCGKRLGVVRTCELRSRAANLGRRISAEEKRALGTNRDRDWGLWWQSRAEHGEL